MNTTRVLTAEALLTSDLSTTEQPTRAQVSAARRTRWVRSVMERVYGLSSPPGRRWSRPTQRADGNTTRLYRSPACFPVDADIGDDRCPRVASVGQMPGPQHSSLRAQLAAHQWQLVPPHRLRPVQRPCARIVEAGLLARQQVERDLHDGAQQRLLAVAATLARTELVATDEERVAVITDARQQLSQALSELRSLALGIHPVLTQGGLAAALRSLADRAAISVDLNIAADLRTRRLSATAEATLWFVASEAIANAVKYSNASRITLTLATANEQLQLTVADNGRGGAQLRRGGGLAGLAKRVGALGGAFSVNSLTDGGTRVEAVLPCAF